MDRNLALEVVRVTEVAAIAAARLMGRGIKDESDQAAVDAMRRELNKLPIHGTVVIGEGERDEAPMLFIGEEVGCEQERDRGPDMRAGQRCREQQDDYQANENRGQDRQEDCPADECHAPVEHANFA